MKIEINIPDEFVEHFKHDKFADTLQRLKSDAHLIAGNYEKETAEMLIKAFTESQPVYEKSDLGADNIKNHIQSEILKFEQERKDCKTFMEIFKIDCKINGYKEIESKLSELQGEKGQNNGKRIETIDFSRENCCDEIVFGDAINFSHSNIMCEKYEYVNVMLNPTYNLVEQLCDRTPIYSEKEMSFEEIMNNTDITFDIYASFYENGMVTLELSTSDYDNYMISLSKKERDSLSEMANEYCIHNVGKTIQQALYVESDRTREDMNKITYLAIESTEDYATADFHKNLVDTDIQNKDGTYGKVVDYYRIVTIGTEKNVVPLNNKIFESFESAVKSIPATHEFEIINYDDMIHLSAKEQAYIKMKNTENSKTKDFTFVVNECMEYDCMGEKYDNVKSIDEAIKILKKLQGNKIAGIGIHYKDMEYELISGNGTVIIDDEFNQCVFDTYPKELKDSDIVKNALKTLHKEFDTKETERGYD